VEPIQIPEDLAGLSETELTELGLEIKERVEGLAEDARTSDETLAQVEGLISDFDRINDELNTREEAAATRSARLDAALERFGPADDGETEDVEEVVAEDAEADSADEVTDEAADEGADDETEVEVAAAADDAAEFTTETEAPEVAVAEFTAEEAPVEEATEEFTIEVEAEEAPAAEFTSQDTQSDSTQEVTEVADSNDRRPTVARLRDRRPEAVAPRSRPSGGAILAARGIGGNVTEGQTIDISALAKAITDKRIAMGNSPSGTFDKITVASATVDFGEDMVGGGAQENFATLRRLGADDARYRSEVTTVVASGGVCAPLEPNYDFFRLADAMNPVEGCLPTAGAPRGGIRFISPPDWRDACPGVRVTTEAEDAAGYVSQGGPTPDKPCVAVECPPIEECRVDAVSQCVTFGNLNYRVFPEQVEAFLADLAVCFAETKEIFYLDAIDAGSTPVTYTAPYGASRGLAYSLSVTAANYRRRHHMSPNATLQVLLPSWAMEFLKIDMLNDHSLGLANWCLSDADVACWFAQNNLDVCFYYDSATGAGQAFNNTQAAGVINEWPDTVVAYLFAPGTFVRLDAGTLDVGLIRDSALNGTNDLQLFSEQWVQVCKVGIESLRLELTLCPNGTAPEPVAPFDCD
jgi:hypothetical protein